MALTRMLAELKVNVGKGRHGGQQLGLEHESELYMGRPKSEPSSETIARQERPNLWRERGEGHAQVGND